MSETIHSCNSCGIASFKTNQSYQRHLQAKKHVLRQEKAREDLFQCNKCNKWYCGKTGLSHHKSICCISQISISEKIIDAVSIPLILHQQKGHADLKEAFEIERQQMKLAFEESMKEQINQILEKYAKTGTTNHNTNNNNIETQNINIIINAFGNENTDYIDDHTILACIGRVYKSIPSLLEKIYFDPKHPENHNIKITNKKLPYASVMGINQKWKTVDRKDAIETMVLNGYNMLDEKYTENKEKISSSKQLNFEGFQSKFESEEKEIMKQIKTDVDMMILNGRS